MEYTLTKSQARQIARSMERMGYWGIEIVERFSEGGVFVNGYLGVGRVFTVRNLDDAYRLSISVTSRAGSHG